MKPAPRRNWWEYASRGVAGLSLFLFVFLQAAAAVPALHLLIHHDANDVGHECAVTLFTHGQAHHSTAAAAPARPAPRVAGWEQLLPTEVSSVDIRLLPCRGPPSLLSA